MDKFFPFWYKHKTLMLGAFYQNIRNGDDFDYFRSYFKQTNYNLFKIKSKNLDSVLDKYNHIKENELSRGYRTSIYLKDNLEGIYKDKLSQEGFTKDGDDVWVLKKVSDTIDLPNKFKVKTVDSNNFDDYLNLVQLSFPDYDNNSEYCNFCFDLSNKKDKNNINYLFYIDSSLVFSGSILYDSDLQYGFIHNVCTHPEYRKQGIFSYFLDYMENFAKEKGVEYLSANVEGGGGSHRVFKNKDYNDYEKYYYYN
ncbi:GNAT family N-acetyltransferase [Candidatus Dojkabacteria bacterium]|uniref:GNAT family N-acetyltransferase n=1 Tax=Candidatus Dojkabacteria bacterium TaxID=2099670 RepID=A0A955RH51_9BACT|nr:GNAT family N-acetyltransferase [Candidatus Dojkabacteria bacterium]